jgi:hypothetical protein
MEIPIVDNYELTLYKPIPLLIKLSNNLYSVIVLNSDYKALDKSRLFYLDLSAIQISKCKKTINQLICPHDQQMQHVDESCEISIFRKPNILPNSCVTNYVKLNYNIWHRFEDTNSKIIV